MAGQVEWGRFQAAADGGFAQPEWIEIGHIAPRDPRQTVGLAVAD